MCVSERERERESERERATEGSSGSLRDDEGRAEWNLKGWKRKSVSESNRALELDSARRHSERNEEEMMVMKRSLQPHCSKQELCNYKHISPLNSGHWIEIIFFSSRDFSLNGPRWNKMVALKWRPWCSIPTPDTFYYYTLLCQRDISKDDNMVSVWFKKSRKKMPKTRTDHVFTWRPFSSKVVLLWSMLEVLQTWGIWHIIIISPLLGSSATEKKTARENL